MSVDNKPMNPKLFKRCQDMGQTLKKCVLSFLLGAVLLYGIAGLQGVVLAASQDNQTSQESGGSTTAGPDPVSIEQGIEVMQASLLQVAGRDDYWLSADLSVLLNPTLSDAVNRGVALYFVLEAELLKPRWYWTDDRLVGKSRIYRLHYHAITRQYRLQSLSANSQALVASGLSFSNPSSWLASLGIGSVSAPSTNHLAQTAGLHQGFASLREALQAMGRVRAWPLIENMRLQPGQPYELRLRMRLDASQLPRPLQIPGISQKDWSIEGTWKRFPFEIGTKKSAP
jgi:hypothetical protein